MRLMWPATFAAATLGSAACDSATTPDERRPATSLTLDGTPGNIQVTVQSEGFLRAECPAEVRAAVTGGSGGPMRWQGGRMLFAYGMNRTVTTDTVPLTTGQVSEAWGSNTFGPGWSGVSQWRFWAGVPFTVTLELHYRVDSTGADGTASYTFTCGPTPPSAGVPAPAVRNVRVFFGGDSVGQVLPGRVLEVRYEAQGDQGIWSSGVQVTGAFTARVPSRNAVTVFGPGVTYGSVQVLVPENAAVGQPIQIQAYAYDPFLRTGMASPPGPVQVVSNVPPRLRYAYFKTAPRLNEGSRLVGRFAEGDTLQLFAASSDSRNAGWLVYTLSGGGVNVRDSLPVPQSGGHIDARIPVRQGWAGASRFSVQVVNDQRMYSAELASPPDSFGVVPERTVPTRSVTFATPAGDVVHDAARGLLYVALPNTRTVQVVSLATMATSPLSLPGTGLGPVSLDLTRGGDTLIAAVPGDTAVAIIDLARPSAPPVKVEVTAAGAPIFVHRVRVAADGRVLVSGTPAGSWQVVVVEMNSSGGGQRERGDTQGVGVSMLVGRSADRGRLFFEHTDHRCIAAFESATNRFGSCFAVERYGSFSSTPSGSRFASGYDVFDAAAGRVRVLPLVTGTALNYTTGLSPDGSYLYVGAVGGLAKLRVSDGAYVERIALPVTLEGRILFTTDRQLVATRARVGYPDEPTRIFVLDLP